ncbi:MULTISPECIES: ATP-dependent DNA helicase DinG [Bacillaceae]|uniref:3'-5' exonuclease DinG n=1 Tax=Alkalicoccobacillus plakortidis TaxID=444060 RepID=A0A9D5HZE5_9BACI|nr:MULTISPECIES: ATP-dependent DNA helicase DinG [Bacillaceae]KQL51865.1 DNA polymerase III subunit epsilon [Alkalicoccobacillus plakortidis]
MSQSYVVLDLETTGNAPEQGARIIQIGAVKVEGHKITDRFSTFVDPQCEIPPFITELTGITEKDVSGAPLFEEVAEEVLTFLDGSHFVAHNVPFDKGFLKKQLALAGYQFPNCYSFDTVELSRGLLPTLDSYKLSDLTVYFDMDHSRPHQADSDAEMTAELFIYLHNKILQLPLPTLQALKKITASLKSDWDFLIEEGIQQALKKSQFEDASIDVFRQLALKRIEDEEEEFIEEELPETYSVFEQAYFSEKGKLASQFEQYEIREGQKEMASAVYEAFSDHAHTLIEAGTGTGKTLGYLIPSVYYAKQTNQKVVLSTYSIPLQEQLLRKDLALMKQASGIQVRVAVLKGRQHYLDLRKFEEAALYSEEGSYDVQLTKAQILIWLLETQTGDVEELNLSSGGQLFWQTIQSDASSDLGRFNPWFTRCFYHRSRKQAKEADIIIVNHALLMTDVHQRRAIIPTYSHAVIDEAHHLEETAIDYFGLAVNYLSIGFSLSRLVQSVTQNKSFMNESEGFISVLNEIKEDVEELFRMLHAFVSERQTEATDVGRMSYVYRSFQEEGVLWQGILECAMRVQMNSSSVIEQLYSAIDKEKDNEPAYEERSFIANVKSMVALFEEEVTQLYELLLEYDKEFVYWIEAEPKGAKNAIYLYAKPIRVNERLADDFFATKQSVVLTSATLTVNQSFDYAQKRLGLEDFGVRTKKIPSPFSYEKQLKVFIPTDIPDVRGHNDQLFIQDVAIKLWRLTDSTNKKALVLFTSYDMLKQVYQYVKDLDDERQITLIGQGVTSGSRSRLLKLFRQANGASILLGTNSFWEGIDLAGDALEHLIIVRLPFAPPNQPLTRAQINAAKANGENPFTDLSLPQAVIRFRQGFGRLIRTAKDQGNFFIFDRRVVTTRYGKTFLASLPTTPVYEGKFEHLLEAHIHNQEEE